MDQISQRQLSHKFVCKIWRKIFTRLSSVQQLSHPRPKITILRVTSLPDEHEKKKKIEDSISQIVALFSLCSASISSCFCIREFKDFFPCPFHPQRETGTQLFFLFHQLNFKFAELQLGKSFHAFQTIFPFAILAVSDDSQAKKKARKGCRKAVRQGKNLSVRFAYVSQANDGETKNFRIVVSPLSFPTTAATIQKKRSRMKLHRLLLRSR